MAAPYAFSYNRSPKWVWDRATGIREGTQAGTNPLLDTEEGAAWIERAIAFQQCYAVERDPLLNQELIIKHGDIYDAFSIYSGDRDSFLRWDIEASILAQVSTEDIAVDCGLPCSSVYAYERIFFDVRDKLSEQRYIIHTVFGPGIREKLKDDIGLAWKYYGYFYGPIMLRAMISRVIDPQICATSDSVTATLKDDIRGSFYIQCAELSKYKQNSQYAPKQYLELFTKISEVDKMADNSGTSHVEQIANHLEAMMEQMPFSIGGETIGKDGKSGKMSAENKYLSTSNDLTHEQIIDISLTGKSDSADELSGFKFPEPVKAKENNENH